jgi:hypothetical protein
VVDADDYQFLGVALIIDPERWHWPTSDESGPPQSRQRSLKIMSGKSALHTVRCLRRDSPRRGIAFVEVLIASMMSVMAPSV